MINNHINNQNRQGKKKINNFGKNSGNNQNSSGKINFGD